MARSRGRKASKSRSRGGSSRGGSRGGQRSKRKEDDNVLEIGAIWEKEGRRGDYLSIRIDMPKLMELAEIKGLDPDRDNIDLVAFENQFKEDGDNRPNHRIIEIDPEENAGRRKKPRRRDEYEDEEYDD